ncbi:transposon TX1 uncharacterized [Tanacetum coccineum]
MVSRHQQNPGEGHWTAVKNILKYLRNTKDRFLVYGGEKELRVTGYYDVGCQTDKDDSRSQSGWIFLLKGRAVTWKSSKQDTVANSTCESEYIALVRLQRKLSVKNFIGDLELFQQKYHFVRSKVAEGHVIVKEIRSEDNPADPFIKALAKVFRVSDLRSSNAFSSFVGVSYEGDTRGTGVKGLGENKKRVLDAYKEYYDGECDSNEVFKFGGGNDGEAVNSKCNVNMKQVKEIREMVVVSWILAAKEKKERVHECERRLVKGDEIISVNVRGMGDSGKKGWTSSILKDEKQDVTGLQETKSGVVDDIWIEDIWGGKGYGYSQLAAIGSSSCIIFIWDTRVFECKETIGDERFIAVMGSWKRKSEEVFLVYIYGLHVSKQKTSLWERSTWLMKRWNGAWFIFRNLNVVRSNNDRLNTHVNAKETIEFNNFINESRLVEIPMGETFRSLPNCIKDMDLDFGPKPFRVFNVWMEELDLPCVVEEAWKKERRERGGRKRRGNIVICFVKDLELDGMRKGIIEKISKEDASLLEKPFSEKEVWEAIQGCGGDKAPGPDGFNFKFIRKVWEIIKPKIIGAVEWFWDKMEISKGCNASFVSIIPKSPVYVLFMLTARHRMKFRLERGVRQGDLCPIHFLFILAADGLNSIVNEAVEKGIFKGVAVGENNVLVSHLQYVDDIIFFGEWNKENAKALMCILKCFEEVSGLRDNYNTRKLYSINVNDREMAYMERWMGCDIGEFPFTYLGLPTGENMKRINAWNLVEEKFKKILGEWKARMMSFGGRLTLVKSVFGSLPLYYFSMFRVPLSCWVFRSN